MLWSVPREWTGQTAFILAGGPSLARVDVTRLPGRVIAINNSWYLRPDADVLYFCDLKWWQRHHEAVLQLFTGLHIVTISNEVTHAAVKHLRNSGRHPGLELDPRALRHGSNSGYQAINLAYHFGAARIVLIGYDLRTAGDRTHWHDGHGKTADHHRHMLSNVFLPKFQALVEPLAAAGVEVINATPDSALTCWPYRSLAELVF